MLNYYCKNCNNLVGEWLINEFLYALNCTSIRSKNINPVYFLDCKNCNKFIGLLCTKVCENCFGEDKIYGEETLFNWFLKYKKIMHNKFCCEKCNKYDFRWQYWFFEELTFYK